jgi:hypothetical protein
MTAKFIKICCHYLVVVVLVGGFLPLGQSIPKGYFWSKCSPSAEYTATITENEDELSQISRSLRVKKIDPTLLQSIVAQPLESPIEDVSRLESFYALPLHSRPIFFCQLQR